MNETTRDAAATSSASTATANDAADHRHEERDEAFSSSRKAANAGSSPSVRGLTSRTGSGKPSFQSSAMFCLHLAACIAVMIVSIANLFWRSAAIGLACVAAAALLVGVAVSWVLGERKLNRAQGGKRRGSRPAGR